MAEIPIEKKSGIAWWVWALIAAVVVALLLWIVLDKDDGSEVDQSPSATTAAVTTDPSGAAISAASGDGAIQATAITELAGLGDGTDAALVGRDVQLTNVPVGDVPGDASFWIVGEQGQKYYVVLNEVRTPDTAIEGRVDVDAGDRVDLTGTIHSASEGAPPGAAIGTQTDPLPEGVTQYIYAQSAQVRD